MLDSTTDTRGSGSYFEDPGTAGAWIHVTLAINHNNKGGAYPNGYVQIRKNGVVRDQDDLNSTIVVIPGNGTEPMRIGTRNMNSYFQGAIGKVAVYRYELPAARSLAHYSAMK